jgi:hypothetical protein
MPNNTNGTIPEFPLKPTPNAVIAGVVLAIIGIVAIVTFGVIRLTDWMLRRGTIQREQHQRRDTIAPLPDHLRSSSQELPVRIPLELAKQYTPAATATLSSTQTSSDQIIPPATLVAPESEGSRLGPQ